MTDLTFAPLDQGELVPVAKAYSGLTDEEIDQLDRWNRQHTLERSSGAPRRVPCTSSSSTSRHCREHPPPQRGGGALSAHRRWRTDKKPADADTLQTLRSLIKVPR